jgi:hypothetical protein
VLAEGERTGHAHRVVGGRPRLYEAAGRRFLRVVAGARVVHEEHDEIALGPGVYEVRRQREYSPVAIRTVAD